MEPDQPSQPDKQEGTGRSNKGRFAPGTSGNPAGRPPAIPPEVRQRLTEACPDIINNVIQAARGGDLQAARLVLDRIAPVTRSTAAPVYIPELEQATTLSAKAQAIINAIARGECPPDIGATMIQAVGACAKIIEIDELERRLCALEEAAQ